jgi:cytochrome c oxidase subunit 2
MISLAVRRFTFALIGAGALGLAGCSSPRFADAAQRIDRTAVPHQTVAMTAERYVFEPEEVHVKAGTLVTLTITALDGEHGFELSDWDIDVSLEPNEPVTVEFFAPQPGTYEFHCSHFCGMGHFGMNGRLVVEP